MTIEEFKEKCAKIREEFYRALEEAFTKDMAKIEKIKRGRK